MGIVNVANSYEVWKCYLRPDLVGAATYWLTTVDGAGWDWDAGFSHINGIRYPTAVYFKHEEDYLMFKLMYSELLKF